MRGPISRRTHLMRSPGSRASATAAPAPPLPPAAKAAAIRKVTSLHQSLASAAVTTTAMWPKEPGWKAARYCAIIPP
jgi:hypothetical protein